MAWRVVRRSPDLSRESLKGREGAETPLQVGHLPSVLRVARVLTSPRAGLVLVEPRSDHFVEPRVADLHALDRDPRIGLCSLLEVDDRVPVSEDPSGATCQTQDHDHQTNAKRALRPAHLAQADQVDFQLMLLLFQGANLLGETIEVVSIHDAMDPEPQKLLGRACLLRGEGNLGAIRMSLRTMFGHSEFGHGIDNSAWPGQVASFGLHVGVLAILALLVPPALANGDSEHENAVWIAHLLAASGNGEDGAGAREDESSAAPRGKAALDDSPGPPFVLIGYPNGMPEPFQGRANSVEGDTTRSSKPEDVAKFGMIDLVSGGNLATSPWSVAGALEDGNGMGLGLESGFAPGGLALSGTGEGGGGRGEGVNIGDIGSLGHGSGIVGGEGVASGHGRIGGSHSVRGATLRCGSPVETKEGVVTGCATQVNGRLPPETIQRIVRQNFGRFRSCYDDALRTNPGLEGRVTVKFVIDRTGQVAVAEDGGSNFPDAKVVACVVRGFESLAFPQPEGGIVTVVYPLEMVPSG
jgi:hypothetical protein